MRPVRSSTTTGLKYRVNQVPRTGDTQLFVDDPNGVTVELNFFAANEVPA